MALPEELLIRLTRGEVNEKDKARAKIEQDVQEFLSKGGEIYRAEPWEGVTEPVKRTRKEQVEWMRKTGTINPKRH